VLYEDAQVNRGVESDVPYQYSSESIRRPQVVLSVSPWKAFGRHRYLAHYLELATL